MSPDQPASTAAKPTKPSKGKCGDCDSKDLIFYDDGSGMCNDCGHIFWWDKARAPAGVRDTENEEEAEEEEEEIVDEAGDAELTEEPVPAPAPALAPMPMYPAGIPPGYIPPPPPLITPQTVQELDPATRKAWKKMKKKFKGGLGPGIMGAISAGSMYIVTPIVIVLMIRNMIPSEVSESDMPYFIRLLFAKLWAIPLLLGWFMVLSGFMFKYYRRGTIQRMVAGLGFMGGKMLYILALMGPFAIDIDMGEAAMGFSYLNYAYIIYILIVVNMLYIAAEYMVLRKDLASYLAGEIPDYYFPKGKRPRQMMIPPPPPPPPGWVPSQPMPAPMEQSAAAAPIDYEASYWQEQPPGVDETPVPLIETDDSTNY